MPLTSLQQDVLAVIVGNRGEESHFAGGTILNAAADSARYSNDFDIFHEVAEEVVRASNRDVESLRHAGFLVNLCNEFESWNKITTFRKATLLRGEERLEIDWAADSAVRFFPVETDPVLGWRLHLFDMATNKALALAARSVSRDYIDIVALHKTYPLSAICWAACGKDEGYSPQFLLTMMKRFAKIDPAKVREIQAHQIDQISLKKAWIAMSDEAEIEMTQLANNFPTTPIGVAFVDASGQPDWIGRDPSLRVHYPSVRGCWPTVHGIEL
jgi:Nucleotidyl transferase AbiEii toxin, Type IV TA system